MISTYVDSDDETVSLPSDNESTPVYLGYPAKKTRITCMRIPGNEVKVNDLIKVFGKFMEIKEIDAKMNTFLLWLEDERVYIIHRYEIRDIIRVNK